MASLDRGGIVGVVIADIRSNGVQSPRVGDEKDYNAQQGQRSTKQQRQSAPARKRLWPQRGRRKCVANHGKSPFLERASQAANSATRRRNFAEHLPLPELRCPSGV